MLWFSGGKETAEALENGKRFIIPVDGGKIEGRDVAALTVTADTSDKPQDKKTEVLEEPIIPKAVEPPKEDLTVIPAVQKSQNPIADVSPDMSEKKNDLTLPRAASDGR
jgi:hypothetical protein